MRFAPRAERPIQDRALAALCAVLARLRPPRLEDPAAPAALLAELTIEPDAR